MLWSRKELVKSIRLAQTLGLRQYGHFDHDANCIAGPFSVSELSGDRLGESRSGDAAGPLLRVEEDPLTGEVLITTRR